MKSLIRPHPALLQDYAHINGLERRPGFVIAADDVVKERFLSEPLPDPGVEGRPAGHRQDRPRPGVHANHRRPLRPVSRRDFIKVLFDHILHPAVDGQRHDGHDVIPNP